MSAWPQCPFLYKSEIPPLQPPACLLQTQKDDLVPHTDTHGDGGPTVSSCSWSHSYNQSFIHLGLRRLRDEETSFGLGFCSCSLN